MTDPQTAAGAAGRVQRWLDEWSFKVQSNLVVTGCGRNEPDDCTELTAPDIDALLVDRKRMAAELEQVRGCHDTLHDKNTALHELVAELTDARVSKQWRLTAPSGNCQVLPRETVEGGTPWPEGWTVETRNVRFGPWLPQGAETAASTAPGATGATQTGEQRADGKRTPEQWCAEYGIDIADPDGWRGRNDPPWDEPITLPDFLRRAAVSTTRGLTPDLWNRLSREAHEAADAERSGAEGTGKGPESP